MQRVSVDADGHGFGNTAGLTRRGYDAKDKSPTGVRLARKVQVTALELREALNKGLEEVGHFLADGGVVVLAVERVDAVAMSDKEISQS
jgi:hypothetical protein